jgi:hypothetical protein
MQRSGNRNRNQRPMSDTVLEIGIIQDALQAIGFGHLVLMHQGFMRAAQRRRYIQSRPQENGLRRCVTTAPSGN